MEMLIFLARSPEQGGSLIRYWTKWECEDWKCEPTSNSDVWNIPWQPFYFNVCTALFQKIATSCAYKQIYKTDYGIAKPMQYVYYWDHILPILQALVISLYTVLLHKSLAVHLHEWSAVRVFILKWPVSVYAVRVCYMFISHFSKFVIYRISPKSLFILSN